MLLLLVDVIIYNQGEIADKRSNPACSAEKLFKSLRVSFIYVKRVEEGGSADFCETFTGAGESV